MGLGIAGLMRGAGAGAGLQDLIKQRLLEREMALREQAQRASEQQHSAELEQRSQELGETRDMNAYFRGEGVRQADQRIMQDAAENLKGTYTKGQVVGDPQVALLRATGMGHLAQPTPMDMPESATDLPGDKFMGATFAGLPEKPSPTKLMTPEERAEEIGIYEEKAKINARYPSNPSTGGGGGLTPGGLDVAAWQYAQTGQMPPLGMGSSEMRSKIINRAAELVPNLSIAASGADYRANSGSLLQLNETVQRRERLRKTGVYVA